jgi:hypothetical protein
LEDEKERIWKTTEQHTDQLHEQHPNRHPTTTQAVSKIEPHWTNQDGDPGSNSQDHMISCLLAGMGKNSCRQVNYDRTKEVTQDPDENPTIFLNHLMEAMTKYTNLNQPPKRVIFSYISISSASQTQISEKSYKNSKRAPRPLNKSQLIQPLSSSTIGIIRLNN